MQTPAEQFKHVVKQYMEQVAAYAEPGEESPLPPRSVLIEPTNACNLRCVHCHHHISPDGIKKLTRKIGIMKMPVYCKTIDECAALGASITLNTQGEPTLHPEFAEMVTYAKSKGVHTSVLSNGTRMTEELARHLISLPLDRMVFSFDGSDKETYESIRIKSKFEPTLLNVLRFMKINHEAGHPTHVCMSAVDQRRNRDTADHYEEYFSRLPVDKIFRNPLLNLSGASGTRDEIDLVQIRTGKETVPICRIAWESLTVNWDGEVGPCPVDVNVMFSLGNVKDATLMELWNNGRMRLFRRSHITGQHHIAEENGPLCSVCNCLWDPDYDMRRFHEHAVEGVFRSAEQFAHALGPKKASTDDQRYANLLEEIARLEEIQRAEKKQKRDPVLQEA